MPIKIVPKKGGPKNFTRKSTRKTGGEPSPLKRPLGGVARRAKARRMTGGGKLKMVEKDGKKVPFFAADGKGKMAGGGRMNKKGYAMGGPMKKKGMAAGGPMKKKGMKKGGMMKKGYAKGGSVKVKSGDTLSQIAKSRGMTVKALLDANPGIKNANMIRVGQSIKIPGAAGAGAKSKNPFKGMTQTQMNMLRSKDKGKQRAATSGARAQTRTTPSNAASVKASKDGSKSALEKARARRAAAKKAAPKKAAPKNNVTPPKSKPGFLAKTLNRLKGNRPGKMTGGGAMKKKGMKKGGAMNSKGMARGGSMKRSKGGTVRGAGAATRGKRFGRAG